MDVDQPRQGRRDPSGTAARVDLVAEPFRADRDRVATSPFFSRLAGVTQVVSPNGSGLLLHNRLTHSLRVAQVGRAIVARITGADGDPATLHELGGCDADVVEAAALAHDLGHPPFGHLGEQVLDRLARNRFGLPDGFEGNAQSFRIITTTDARGLGDPGPYAHKPGGVGLALTAAVRAAVLKYPWTRSYHPMPHPSTLPVPPRGAAAPADAPGSGSAKFSCYVSDLDDFSDAREAFAGKIEPWQQTVEASVMDTADDIAYAIHDLEDFHRVGVLRYSSVATELDEWERNRAELAAMPVDALDATARQHGHSLERLWRRLCAKDGWIADEDAFRKAIADVRTALLENLLREPFDGSVAAERAVAEFSGQWGARLVRGVEVRRNPPVRSGHVGLNITAWHEVQVLKFVHNRFVLLRPDLALQQRGQAQLLTNLVEALDSWLSDRAEADRLPRRLHDLVALAEQEYEYLAEQHPEALRGPGGEIPQGPDARHTLARGRAVIDFLSSLTDGQAHALLDALSGRPGQSWTDTFVL